MYNRSYSRTTQQYHSHVWWQRLLQIFQNYIWTKKLLLQRKSKKFCNSVRNLKVKALERVKKVNPSVPQRINQWKCVQLADVHDGHSYHSNSVTSVSNVNPKTTNYKVFTYLTERFCITVTAIDIPRPLMVAMMMFKASPTVPSALQTTTSISWLQRFVWTEQPDWRMMGTMPERNTQ